MCITCTTILLREDLTPEILRHSGDINHNLGQPLLFAIEEQNIASINALIAAGANVLRNHIQAAEQITQRPAFDSTTEPRSIQILKCLKFAKAQARTEKPVEYTAKKQEEFEIYSNNDGLCGTLSRMFILTKNSADRLHFIETLKRSHESRRLGQRTPQWRKISKDLERMRFELSLKYLRLKHFGFILSSRENLYLAISEFIFHMKSAGLITAQFLFDAKDLKNANGHEMGGIVEIIDNSYIKILFYDPNTSEGYIKTYLQLNEIFFAATSLRPRPSQIWLHKINEMLNASWYFDQQNVNPKAPVLLTCFHSSAEPISEFQEFASTTVEKWNRSLLLESYKLLLANGYTEALERVWQTFAPTLYSHADGESAILYAVQEGDLANVQNLLRHVPTVDINGSFKLGQHTALHVAAYRGYLDIVIFLSRLPNIVMNPVDKFGSTPFFLAAQSGHLPIINFLLQDSRVDFMKPNYNQISPLEIAGTNDYMEITSAILSHTSSKF